MSAFLDEQYFEWLYAQIAQSRSTRPSARTYFKLCHILFTTEFVWVVPYDDNRVQDGKDLRYDFLDSESINLKPQDEHWLTLECSVFEVLVALARHLAFETDTEPYIWFWEMLENTHLDKYNDRAYIPETRIKQILNQVMYRTYKRDGSGGLFPLARPDRDQRKAQLWHQLNSYILERGY